MKIHFLFVIVHRYFPWNLPALLWNRWYHTGMWYQRFQSSAGRFRSWVISTISKQCWKISWKIPVYNYEQKLNLHIITILAIALLSNCILSLRHFSLHTKAHECGPRHISFNSFSSKFKTLGDYTTAARIAISVQITSPKITNRKEGRFEPHTVYWPPCNATQSGGLGVTPVHVTLSSVPTQLRALRASFAIYV